MKLFISGKPLESVWAKFVVQNCNTLYSYLLFIPCIHKPQLVGLPRWSYPIEVSPMKLHHWSRMAFTDRSPHCSHRTARHCTFPDAIVQSSKFHRRTPFSLWSLAVRRLYTTNLVVQIPHLLNEPAAAPRNSLNLLDLMRPIWKFQRIQRIHMATRF